MRGRYGNPRAKGWTPPKDAWVAVVRKDALLHALSSGNGCHQPEHRPNRVGVGIEVIEIEIEIDSRAVWRLALTHRSNLAAETCQHCNNTVALRGISCPNPISPPFDTDSGIASPILLRARSFRIPSSCNRKELNGNLGCPWVPIFHRIMADRILFLELFHTQAMQ